VTTFFFLTHFTWSENSDPFSLEKSASP